MHFLWEFDLYLVLVQSQYQSVIEIKSLVWHISVNTLESWFRFAWFCTVNERRNLSRWRHNWKSAQVVTSHLMCDPTIRRPGFDLPRQQWSLLNRFCMEQGHCGACRRKWRLTDTDLCSCGETKTMSQIVESCPLTKLNGGLSRLHSADEDAVSWLTNYGSWHAYEKKKLNVWRFEFFFYELHSTVDVVYDVLS